MEKIFCILENEIENDTNETYGMCLFCHLQMRNGFFSSYLRIFSSRFHATRVIFTFSETK